MIYSKKLFWMGFVFIAVGIMGILSGKLLNAIGFFPLAVSAFAIYDKEDPKVKYPKLREALFVIGLVLAFVVWFLIPKIFPDFLKNT